MVPDLSDRQFAAVFVAGLVVAFGVGFVASGVNSPTGAVTEDGSTDTVSQDVVRQKVTSYVTALGGERADISVVGVSDSEYTGLYKVDIEVTAQGPDGQERTQESSLYVTKDGSSVFLRPPQDLDNPPEPQPQPQPQPPQ